MKLSERLTDIFDPVVYFGGNWITTVGVLLTTTGGVAWLFTLPRQLTGQSVNPYLGLLTAFALPIVFFLGLFLIPLGIRLKQRKARSNDLYPATFPPLDFSNAKFRRLLALTGAATAANVVIGGHLTFAAIEEMDTVDFCGQSCHIMGPEFTAFQHAPHSQLRCVDCHIGEGFDSYVAAKVNGAKQLIEVLTNTYPTPVPTPVHNLAQGTLTCNQCHADQNFGTTRREWITFAEDEANSPARTEMLLQIGGGDDLTGAHGAHFGGGAGVEYRSDRSREKISWMRYTDANGSVVEYADDSWNPDDADQLELRQMDCVDCHNRAAHSFEAPHKALDAAMAEGKLDTSLPYLRREALKVLRGSYSDHEEATAEIPEALRAFYAADYPEVLSAKGEQIDGAAEAVLAIYKRNVFPEFKVAFGTHPNQGGHEDYPGCFRCHDQRFKPLDGASGGLTDRCETCHDTRVIDQPISAPSVPLLTESRTLREIVPRDVLYNSAVGEVAFDHAEHITLADNDCTSCHNRLFPMRQAPLYYGGADGHAVAEEAQVSCAGCHIAGTETFGAQRNCERCHTNLTSPKSLLAMANVERAELPGNVSYETTLGVATFDHAKHAERDDTSCASCHNQLFPMQAGAMDYGKEMHRAAEAAQSSCAGCHVEGGTAFASTGSCEKCHEGLGEPIPTPLRNISGISESLVFGTRLGEAKFGHERHVELAKGDCTACHNKIFPLEKGLLGYKDDLHRSAESAKTSCAACHVDGGEAFPAKDHCTDCHTDLTATVRGSDMDLPAKVVYPSRLGDVAFDHDEHIVEAKGDCRQCHNEIYPMEKVADLAYVDDYHRTAEAEKKSCAACHVEGGGAFASIEKCDLCHQDLELPKRARGFFPPLGMLFFFPFPAPDDAESSGYIGSKRCAVCHEEESDGFNDNPHLGLRDTERFEAKETYCESCHGPGLKHVLALDPAELTDFRVAQPAIVNDSCLNCHAQDDGFENHAIDAHARGGVSCTDCHGVHQATARDLLTSESTQLCSSCHTDVRASFNRPFGHKLAAGGTQCIDCHNPHGDVPREQTARVFANETSCIKCHGDKRGPFPFEHAPVRVEPCSSCHEPHGSANPRMLTRHTSAQLCMECHSMIDGSLGAAPPAFHDPRSARFQSCTVCHSKIHGSYVSRDLLR